MKKIKEDTYYNIDLVPYKVYEETEKFLIIENFLKPDLGKYRLSAITSVK